jgi:hypothetical protein
MDNLANQSVQAMFPGIGAITTNIGARFLNAGGVVFHESDAAIGYFIAMRTATTPNTQAYLAAESSTCYRSLGFSFSSAVHFPDASYGSGTTGTRAGVGLIATTATNMISADTLATAGCGFQFSTNRGDVNWQFITCNGTAQTTVNTAMVFAPSKLYQTEFSISPNGGSLSWKITNLTDNIVKSGAVSTNLPPATTGLMLVSGIRTLGNTAIGGRLMRIKRLYCSTPI